MMINGPFNLKILNMDYMYTERKRMIFKYFEYCLRCFKTKLQICFRRKSSNFSTKNVIHNSCYSLCMMFLLTFDTGKLLLKAQLAEQRFASLAGQGLIQSQLL